jgi:hypothetical protein
MIIRLTLTLLKLIGLHNKNGIDQAKTDY